MPQSQSGPNESSRERTREPWRDADLPRHHLRCQALYFWSWLTHRSRQALMYRQMPSYPDAVVLVAERIGSTTHVGSTAVRRRAETGRQGLQKCRHLFAGALNTERRTGVMRSDGVIGRNLFARRRR